MPKSATPPPNEKLVLVGRIGAAHGIKGDVRLTSFTQDPTAIGAYGPLSDARGARRFKIFALRPLKGDLLVAGFEGVATRAAAEVLNNTELYVERAAFAPPAEDEFYHADLIGLAARNPIGEPIGRVAHVLNFGGGDILEISPADGGETLLVAFTKEAVPVVDLEAREIVVAPPLDTESSLEADLAQEAAPRRAQASSR